MTTITHLAGQRLGTLYLFLMAMILLPARMLYAQSEISFTTQKEPGTQIELKVKGADDATISIEGVQDEYSPTLRFYTTTAQKIVVKGDVVELSVTTDEITEFFVDCPTLERLDLTFNKLETLDLTKAPALKHFSCAGNELTTLDLSAQKSLEHFSCANNQLTSLTLDSDVIRFLSCHRNHFSREAFTALTGMLPDLSSEVDLDEELPGKIILQNNDNHDEENDISNELLLTLVEKGWQPYRIFGTEQEPLNPVMRDIVITMHTQTPIGETIGLDIVPVDGKSFEIEGVEEADFFSGWGEYTVASPEIKIYGQVNSLIIQPEDNTNLRDIDFSKATSLKYIDIFTGGDPLTELEFKNLESLEHVKIMYSPTFTSLTVSDCPNLTDLNVDRNGLTEINVSNCPQLCFMSVFQNKLGKDAMNRFVEALPMREESDTYRHLYLVNSLSPEEGNVWNDKILKKIMNKNWLPIDWYLTPEGEEENNEGRPMELGTTETLGITFKTKTPVGGSIKFGAVAVNYGTLTIEGVITDLWHTGGKYGKDVTYQVAEGQTITIHGDVKKLYINNAELTEIDLSQAPSLEYLELANNELSSLDLSHNGKVEYVFADYNELSSILLDRGGGTYRLNCTHNLLRGDAMVELVKSLPDFTSTNVKGIIFFKDLDSDIELNECTKAVVRAAAAKNWDIQARKDGNFEHYDGIEGGDEPIPEDSNIQLQTKRAIGQEMTIELASQGEVEIEGLEGVVEPNGSKTYKITSQDIVIKGEITLLSVPDCDLTFLNVQKCLALATLKCSNNSELKRLNLTENKELNRLECQSTDLSILDLNNNNKLVYLNCSNNKLRTLDLSANKELISVYCYDNEIKGEKMDALVESIADRSGLTPAGELVAINLASQSEANRAYERHATELKAKSWHLKSIDNGKLAAYDGVEEPYITFTTQKAVGDKIQMKIVSLGKVTFEGLSGEWVNDKKLEYTIKSQQISVRGELCDVHCYGNEITEMDFTHADYLYKVDCSNNLLNEVSMDRLIATLPIRPANAKGEIVVHDANKEEKNVCTKKQAYDARQRNWTTLYYAVGGGYRIYPGDEEDPDIETDNIIKLKTNLPIGKTVTLTIQATPPQITTNPTVVFEGLKAIDGGAPQYVYNTPTPYMLTSQEFSLQGEITLLKCEENHLTEIDMSNSNSVNILTCYGNDLTSINLKNQTKLTDIFCQKNKLTTLDLSDCTHLVFLACAENNINPKGFEKILNTIVDRKYDVDPGTIIFYNAFVTSPEDVNRALEEQVKSANKKNWRVWKITHYDPVSMLYDFGEYTPNVPIEIAGEVTLVWDNAQRVLSIANASSGEPVLLYDIAGSIIYSVCTDVKGTALLDLTGQPDGVYIIRIGRIAQRILLAR